MILQTPSLYETDALLNQYLLFHYGNPNDLMPFSFGPQNSLHFPIRCVTECLDLSALPKQAKGLDLGCAVGRSSFELARHCQHVLAVDNSKSFIAAAQHLQKTGRLEYFIAEEGKRQSRRLAEIPNGITSDRVTFKCCDVMELAQHPIAYDVVLAANLICRLSEPDAFLFLLPHLVAPEGQLILTSPYSWLEEFTPRSSWLGTLEGIQNFLAPSFSLQRTIELPFLIREHLRKYQWGVAQASIWKRNRI